jgi:hypothetical protein
MKRRYPLFELLATGLLTLFPPETELEAAASSSIDLQFGVYDHRLNSLFSRLSLF